MQTSHQPFLQKKRLALPRRPRLAPDEKKKASREPPGCNFHEPCKCSGLHGTESERRLVPTYAFVTQSPLHTTRTLHKRHSVHRRNDDRITCGCVSSTLALDVRKPQTRLQTVFVQPTWPDYRNIVRKLSFVLCISSVTAWRHLWVATEQLPTCVHVFLKLLTDCSFAASMK